MPSSAISGTCLSLKTNAGDIGGQERALVGYSSAFPSMPFVSMDYVGCSIDPYKGSINIRKQCV